MHTRGTLRGVAAIAAALVMATSTAAWGDIMLTIPDTEVDENATSAEVTVTVEFDGGVSYDVDAYFLWIDLTPVGSASGVTLDDANTEEAATDYLFADSPGFTAVADSGTRVAGDDDADGTEAFEDVTKNVITIPLVLDTLTEGDQFELTFGTQAPFATTFWEDTDNDVTHDVTLNGGTITITPEPISLALLVLGVPAVALRRRRK